MADRLFTGNTLTVGDLLEALKDGRLKPDTPLMATSSYGLGGESVVRLVLWKVDGVALLAIEHGEEQVVAWNEDGSAPDPDEEEDLI